MNHRIEMHAGVFMCAHLRVMSPGTWCAGPVEACWEALIHFQQRVLLHQLDNEGQQCGRTSEISFTILNYSQKCSLWSLGWNLHLFKNTSCSMRQPYVKMLLLAITVSNTWHNIPNKVNYKSSELKPLWQATLGNTKHSTKYSVD